uniref:endo-1,4-beta-xylanase n=1 Tax=uncultured bacterium contig00029 TaxID=1181518 RepID=A0A806KKG7_9BACT|nr:chain A, Family 11 Xylanase [uncultured bacterium contig00029]
MKKFILALLFAAFFCDTLFAQTVLTTSTIRNDYNGYDYELWNQNNSGTVRMELTGDNGSGTNAKGGTFTAQWSNTENVLFRAGKKWGSSSTQNHTQIGNMSVEFAATWSSGDNVKMLGIYGWAYFTSANVPTKQENGSNETFSNQIEYYIIQDRGSYNPATQSQCKNYGSATIDNIAYDFQVCDRINQPMLTGNGNFKQFISVPKSISSHRQSGTVSVSQHFNAWHNVGMKMDGPLYEVAMKVESYTGAANSNGNATVTKNLLTIGGTPSESSSSGTGSSSGSSSQKCGDYQASFCGGKPFGDVLDNSTAVPSNGECIFIEDFETIQPALNSTVSINDHDNVCGNDWDPNDDNLGIGCPWAEKPSPIDGGYYVYVKIGSINCWNDDADDCANNPNGWKGIVSKTKPVCEEVPIRLLSPISTAQFSVRSLSNSSLQIESNSDVAIYLYNAKGKLAQKIDVPTGSSIVKLSVPAGIYVVKNGKTKQTQRILVK